MQLQVSSWAIKDGRCHYRNRYVRTDAFMAEQEAGRMLFKGAFSRGDPAGCPPTPVCLRAAPFLRASHGEKHCSHMALKCAAVGEAWLCRAEDGTCALSCLGQQHCPDSPPPNEAVSLCGSTEVKSGAAGETC